MTQVHRLLIVMCRSYNHHSSLRNNAFHSPLLLRCLSERTRAHINSIPRWLCCITHQVVVQQTPLHTQCYNGWCRLPLKMLCRLRTFLRVLLSKLLRVRVGVVQDLTKFDSLAPRLMPARHRLFILLKLSRTSFGIVRYCLWFGSGIPRHIITCLVSGKRTTSRVGSTAGENVKGDYWWVATQSIRYREPWPYMYIYMYTQRRTTNIRGHKPRSLIFEGLRAVSVWLGAFRSFDRTLIATSRSIEVSRQICIRLRTMFLPEELTSSGVVLPSKSKLSLLHTRLPSTQEQIGSIF